MSEPIFVAHRGDMQNYPENTLEGIEAALQVGAQAIEFDVQLSQDGVPVLYHDESLERTSDRVGKIYEFPYEYLGQTTAGEAKRFGEKYAQVTIPRLSDLVERMEAWPQVRLFVEVKRQSLDAFGITTVIKGITQCLVPIERQCVLISYRSEALAYARKVARYPIGWVLRQWDKKSHEHAIELAPDYLICDYELIPDTEEFWQGPWEWVLYDATDHALASALAQRGAKYVETKEIARMLGDRG